MAELSIHEIKLIEILVLKDAFIRTNGKRFYFLGKGAVYLKSNKGPPIYCTVSGKTIKHLYRRAELLTCRQIRRYDGWEGNTSWHIHWEVYLPNLFEFECLKELQAQYAVGSVK